MTSSRSSTSPRSSAEGPDSARSNSRAAEATSVVEAAGCAPLASVARVAAADGAWAATPKPGSRGAAGFSVPSSLRMLSRLNSPTAHLEPSGFLGSVANQTQRDVVIEIEIGLLSADHDETLRDLNHA